MKKVYAIADNIVSPLGFDSQSNWAALLRGESGVKAHNKPGIRLPDFHASLLEDEKLEQQFSDIASPADYTRLEQLSILSIREAIEQCDVKASSARTMFVFSTTKGNIDRLTTGNANAERLRLPAMARHITRFFGNPNPPVVLSNACISGVSALLAGSYYIREGLYDQVVVMGGDIISEFTLSGFSSLQALSAGACKPFDQHRDGINLGEAGATIILSGQARSGKNIEISRGATSNDANHISGPSRTGEGLALAIKNALEYSGLASQDVGYVSAHGTATMYNDEMEAKALHTNHLNEVPVNSLKGYYGHTLGAAGVLETILAMWSLQKQTILASKGYSQHGVSLPLPVVTEPIYTNFRHCLKTASGFGGCNAALVISKND